MLYKFCPQARWRHLTLAALKLTIGHICPPVQGLGTLVLRQCLCLSFPKYSLLYQSTCCLIFIQVCLTDDKPICAICKLFGDHEPHKVAKISEVYRDRKKRLIQDLDWVYQQSEHAEQTKKVQYQTLDFLHLTYIGQLLFFHKTYTLTQSNHSVYSE